MRQTSHWQKNEEVMRIGKVGKLRGNCCEIFREPMTPEAAGSLGGPVQETNEWSFLDLFTHSFIHLAKT